MTCYVYRTVDRGHSRWQPQSVGDATAATVAVGMAMTPVEAEVAVEVDVVREKGFRPTAGGSG